jgi:hypothetical protein
MTGVCACDSSESGGVVAMICLGREGEREEEEEIDRGGKKIAQETDRESWRINNDNWGKG